MLLPDTDEQSCSIVIARIEDSAKRTFDGRGWPITVSIGRTTYIGKAIGVDSVIQFADRNMYEIKRMKQ
jgi:GGDEF domain-containing protein